jgi:hypothetical protein
MMVLRLSVIVQVSSFKCGCGSRFLLRACRRLEASGHAGFRRLRLRRLPIEAVQRRAEVVEHHREIALERDTTAD